MYASAATAEALPLPLQLLQLSLQSWLFWLHSEQLSLQSEQLSLHFEQLSLHFEQSSLQPSHELPEQPPQLSDDDGPPPDVPCERLPSSRH